MLPAALIECSPALTGVLSFKISMGMTEGVFSFKISMGMTDPRGWVGGVSLLVDVGISLASGLVLFLSTGLMVSEHSLSS